MAFGGYLFQDVEVPASEGVGLLAAVVILLVAFGSVVAMGLPIVTALAGVVASIAGLGLWAAVVPTPDFTTQVAMMIGIGVGIDYALFIVTRYRVALQRGLDPHAAAMEAMGTAGRAVVFAGCTVMISLLGLLLMRPELPAGLGPRHLDRGARRRRRRRHAAAGAARARRAADRPPQRASAGGRGERP